MERSPVRSTELRSVGYDRIAQRLEVEFQEGAVYEYFDVPEAAWTGLMHAPSHGRYFNEHIRNRPYRFRRLSGREVAPGPRSAPAEGEPPSSMP